MHCKPTLRLDAQDLSPPQLHASLMLDVDLSIDQEHICRERVRQARANKLALAVQQLDGDNDKENSIDDSQMQRPLYSMLQPAEEALVEQLLAQVTSSSITHWRDEAIATIVSWSFSDSNAHCAASAREEISCIDQQCQPP